MRIFIGLLALIALTGADRLGYDYSQGGYTATGDSPSNNFAVGSIGGSNGGSIGGSNGGSFGSSIGGSRDGGSSDYGAYDSADYAPETEYTKEFFTFTAPEDEFDDPLAAQKLAGTLKKNLRVIFIKAPENRGLENAALALAKNAAEQRTAIYVLNKQSDIGDLANKFNALRNDKNAAPEVRFVKYRTPEDVANAQKAIRSQYDEFGGPGISRDGGITPVLNFASQGPAYRRIAKTPETSYLPASILRRLRYRY